MSGHLSQGGDNFREQLKDMISSALVSLNDSAAAALTKELSPELVTRSAVNLLRDVSSSSYTLVFKEHVHRVLCSGVHLLSDWSSRVAPDPSLIESLRSGTSEAHSAEAYRLLIGKLAELFPNLPPDATLDVLAPSGATYSELLSAMKDARPAVADTGTDGYCKLELSKPQLRLLGQATRLLEEVRRQLGEESPLAVYHERVLFASLRLLADLSQDDQKLEAFRRYADPPLAYEPGTDPRENLKQLARLSMTHDAALCATVEVPWPQAMTILRAGALEGQALTAPLLLRGMPMHLSVQRGGELRLSTHPDHRSQAALDEMYETLIHAGLRQLVDPPSDEQRERNVKTIWLNFGSLRSGVTMPQFAEFLERQPFAGRSVSIFIRGTSPSLLRALDIRAEQIEHMGVGSDELSDHLGYKLCGLHIGAVKALARQLGVGEYSKQAQAELRSIWQEAYGASLTSD